MASKTLNIVIKAPKRRNPIARDLLTPKYRLRVEINRKRALKTGSAKSLISKSFGVDPENLWITLLKTLSGCPGSLENQAFRQNARSMCRK